MPALTDILDEKFLQWLQSTITSTLGKMSVVFEDVNGEPIGSVRMFAPRVDEARQNLCEHMIDCDRNPAAKKACKNSDAESARQAGSKLKTCLYRCHWGRGFVNLAIPIRIWENVVVGNLYAGQFLFKVPKSQQDKFIEELRKHDFLVPEGQTLEKIVRSLDSNEIYEFYKAVIPQELRSSVGFREDNFLPQFMKQQDNGVSSSEFLNAVSLLETLANYLSDLGNRLYTLKSFVDLKRRFPVSLSAQHKTDLDSLEQNIERLILKQKESLSPDERAKAVANVQKLSLKSLLLLKDHETRYLTNLFKPYLEHVLLANSEIQQLALQFYFLKAYYEIERYPKIRGIAERNYKSQPREEGDKIWNQFLDVSKNIGEYEGLARGLVTKGLVKLHENAPFLLKAAKLVPSLMHLYKNDRDAIAKVLHEQGIYRIVAQDLRNSEEVAISSYRVPLHTILQTMEKVAVEMKQITDTILKETGESSESDIEETRKYIDEVTRIRNDIISLVAFNSNYAWALNERRRIDLRYDRAFLNSGGLGITHGAVLEAEKWWVAERNESGPVGINLEEELNSEIEKARTSVASLIGSESPDNIVLTNSTTSSLKFVLDSIRFQQGDEIVFTDLEHDVVVCLVDHLARKFAIIPEISKISDCYEESSKIAQRISERISAKTKLVVLSHVTFSTGSILPLKRIIRKCRETCKKIRKTAGSLVEENLLFLVDGAQAVANIPVDVKDLGCDFYAFDGHKWLLGPEGTGALYIKEFAKKIRKGTFFFPVNTAFMVSPEIARTLKVVNGNGYELGTNDAAKIIGLLASVNVVTTLGLENIANLKELLVSRFLEVVKKHRCYSIVNPKDAPKTGIVCIRIEGYDTAEHYRDIVLKLQELNVFSRYVKRPASLRFCFHYYNSESDVDTAINSLNSLIQRTEIHRANRDLVKEDIKNRVLDSIQKNSSGGLIIYGPPGSGKTTAIEEVLNDLRSKRKLKDWIKIKEEEIYSGKDSPPQSLTKLLQKARKTTPSCVFFDEINAILPKDIAHVKPRRRDYSRYLSALVGTFVTIYDEIQNKGEKVFFIGAANEIENVADKVKKRRMTTAYFPLPSFESRLQSLVDKAQKTKEVENIEYERIAAATDLYSMSDLESLWKEALKLSKGSKIQQHHIEKALDSVKPTSDEEAIEEFEVRIKKEGSEILSHRRSEPTKALKVH